MPNPNVTHCYLEPAKLSGIGANNTTILATMHTLNTVLNDILNTTIVACPADFRTNLMRLEQFQRDFGNSLINLQSPSEYFPFIANGAFKECYEMPISGWVIKYCSVENRTGAERQLLQAAEEYGVKRLFLPSYYIDLPVYIDSVYIDPDDCDYDSSYAASDSQDDNFRRPSLNTVIIQPECITIAECGAFTSFEVHEDYYDRYPVLLSNGKPVPRDLIVHLDVPSLDWLQDIVRCYGDDMLLRFLRFTKDFQMVDLHDRNIGYFTTPFRHEVPILLDWLSNSVI